MPVLEALLRRVIQGIVPMMEIVGRNDILD